MQNALFVGSVAFQFKFSLIPSGISSSFLSGAAIATAISLIAECFERLEQRALCQLLSVVVMFIWFLILIVNSIFFDQLFATSGYVATAVFVIIFFLTLAFGVFSQWNVWRKTVHITSS